MPGAGPRQGADARVEVRSHVLYSYDVAYIAPVQPPPYVVCSYYCAACRHHLVDGFSTSDALDAIGMIVCSSGNGWRRVVLTIPFH